MASASIEVSSSSWRETCKRRYDVFVSFLEKDSGNTLSAHLFDALHQMGIVAFKQDKNGVGDCASGEELALEAIPVSKNCIVVLSKDYASSKKCLRELAKMMDCRSSRTLRVLPVFYHVDPSDVRRQSGSFAQHFEEHNNTPADFTQKQREENAEEVLAWKAAMTKLGNLSGSVVHKTSDEAEIIKKITHQIFNSVLSGLTASNENLVGITSRFNHIYELLDMKSDKVVCFLGIVGMGGIGKTTIAEAIYHKISDQFDDHCFLRISRSDTDIISLQNQLLSTVFKNEGFKVWDEDIGTREITRLNHKKVLLVLDGAEKDIHIKKLAGSPDWFGPGSRVIITTRNKDLLNFPELEMLRYEVKPLEDDDAHQLFCTYAFEEDCSADANYIDLSEKIVKHTHGLPLALKVLGSTLHSRPLAIWKEILENLGKVSDKNIVDILKISFDALEARQQEIFLDIACFFKGRNIDRVIELLESFGHQQLGDEIRLLRSRCLMDILNKKIMMHDLIQDMGQEIVRRESESIAQFGKQSRIWLRDDMNRVLIQKNGFEETRGIVLELDKDGESSDVEAQCFLKMTKLRILEINNVHLTEDLTYLSNLLGYLNWPGYPCRRLPSTFQPENLIELRMPCSHIVQLWEGKKKFGRLKLIDLSDSKNLLKTPDLSGVRNLESLVLHGCSSLSEIHPSITRLNPLSFLDLKDCSNLKTFSSKISCKKLTTFILSGCSSLEKFPEIEGKMEHLAELYLDGTAIENLHPSIGRLTGLVLLNLRECKRLSSLPNVMGNFKSLKTLILHGCLLLDQIELCLENAHSLEELDLSETSLTQAPSSIHHLRYLKVLRCQGLSKSIWHSLNSSSFGLVSLTNLNLSYCNLEDGDIPQDLDSFSSLEILDLSGNHFVSLVDFSLFKLRNLKKLYLDNCTKLQRLPRLIPPSLREVQGRDCVSIAQHFYNKELGIPSTEVGVLSIKFPISNEEQNFKFVEGADIFSVENRMQKQRHLEMKISDKEEFELSVEKDDIFECFDHKEKGTCIEFVCDPCNSTGYHKRFYAIALAVTIQIIKAPILGTISECYFMIRLETDGYPPKILMNTERNCSLMSRAKTCVFYTPFEKLSEEVRDQDYCYIKASITSMNPNVKVEKCGASVLFRKNIGVFLGNMLGKCFRNRSSFIRVTKDRDHLSQGRYVEVEDLQESCPVSYFENDSSFDDSIVLLRRSLKSLLRRTFEEENSDFVPTYIFPQQGISSWFKHQQEQPTLTIKLPLNLQKDKKWMGLAIFVVFSVDKHAGIDYTFSYEVDADEVQCAHFPSIWMPKFLVEGSHQVCVLFHQRASFPYVLNKCDHIHANITTQPDIKVVSCGARLVYQQNVQGLIKTIVDCVCQSPQDLHDYYNHTSLFQFLLSITSLNGIEALRLKPVTTELIIQDPFKSKFDCILHGHKFLSLFTWRAEGNNVTMKLPQSLYRDGSWMGFVLYALVVVDKSRTVNNQKANECLKLVDFVCQFDVDSDIIEPDHYLITLEDDILEGGAEQFIWLFYIPRSEFRVVWRHCACLGASMKTNRPELLSVWECGMHAVSLQDKEIIEEFAASSLQKKQQGIKSSINP